MAVDKLVDSTQLNADLTSVANAIRTKGGTSGQLAFPAGFVQAISDISGGGGTDFTAEWERPSDWPALPNDLDTYSGMYVLFKILEGKTIYRARINTNNPLDIGVTDSLGNFTSLRTQYTGEIDISDLPVTGYFWAKGSTISFSRFNLPECILEPAVEVIICNNSNSFYDGSTGTITNFETVHLLAKNWIHNYKYNMSAFQDAPSRLQCIEFYGGKWANGNIYFPFNANKLVIDGVDIEIQSNGYMYGGNYGRGSFLYNHVNYGNVSLTTNTDLRLNMCCATNDEVQNLINKIGDLSQITNARYMFYGAYNLRTIDFTGLKLINITSAENMFSNCILLNSIVWGESDMSSLTTLLSAFDQAPSISELSFPGDVIRITANNGMNNAFRNCLTLETLNLSNFEFTSNVSFSQTVMYDVALKNVLLKPNAGIANNIGFDNSSLLTNASLVSISNALSAGVSGRSITLHSDCKNKLDAILGIVADGIFTEDTGGSVTLRDFITNVKGWTIS